ncbi:hypothetical protein [Halovivax gelatinilyticus]|uniref:hypothetical protein n=1 Tax=Halovivax gelatinilyticus TaxID=2961597 RepID=UPI0020CA62DC|nr:hypothetical protein [Halovivax gelatinilyticus]
MPIPETLSGYPPETYKRASNASYAVGIVGLVAATLFGYELVGFGVFVLGLVFGMTLPALSERTVHDERDEEHLAETGGIVLSVWGIGGLVVFVSMGLLEALEQFSPSSELNAAFYTWSAFWVFFTITHVFTLVRRRYR